MFLDNTQWKNTFKKCYSKDTFICPHLRLCLDFRGLNHTMVKYPYLLRLVPLALEQLHKVIFTKLDLHSAYNLVCIGKGDEWKTTFSTSCSHYEFLVMPYGLSCAPSVFQSIINDILRDMFGKFIIAYITSHHPCQGGTLPSLKKQTKNICTSK